MSERSPLLWLTLGEKFNYPPSRLVGALPSQAEVWLISVEEDGMRCVCARVRARINDTQNTVKYIPVKTSSRVENPPRSLSLMEVWTWVSRTNYWICMFRSGQSPAATLSSLTVSYIQLPKISSSTWGCVSLMSSSICRNKRIKPSK